MYSKKIYTSFFIFIFILPVILLSKNLIFAPYMFVKPPFLATAGFYKVSSLEIKLYLKINISEPQDIAVVKLKSKDDPTTVNDDDELTGYATDSKLNLLGYNPTLTSAKLYGNDIFEVKFNFPVGIDANIYGNIYLCDFNNKRIVILSNDGYNLHFINQIFLNDKPFDITHKKDKLFVTLKNSNKILILKNRRIIKEIKDKRIKKPTGIKFLDKNDKWNFYKENFLVFINNNGKEIIKMKENGIIKKILNLKNFFNREVKLNFVTIDYYANILVTDEKNNCVHKFDKEINYIATFRNRLNEEALNKPRGIDIWKRYGQLYIIEKTGGRYYWVGIDVKKFNVIHQKKIIKIKYYCTDPFYITMDLFNLKNEIVKHLYRRKFIKKYKGEISFKATNFSNKPLPKGKYILKCKIEPTYSSFTRFYKIITRKIEIK